MDAWEGEISALYSQYAHHPESFFAWCCDQLLEYAPFHPGMRVLDLAGGSGLASRRFLERCPGARITILDASAGQLEHAKDVFGDQVAYVGARAEQYDPEEKFELVLCANAFWYLHSSIVPRIKSWLGPEGIFLFNLHEQNSLFREQSFFGAVNSEVDRLSHEKYRRACLIYQQLTSVEQLREQLANAGFAIAEQGARYDEPKEVWQVLCELEARRIAPYMGMSISPEEKIALYRQAFRAVAATRPVQRHTLIFRCKKNN
jgi:trans-aconitate methyltransferase